MTARAQLEKHLADIERFKTFTLHHNLQGSFDPPGGAAAALFGKAEQRIE
jgi:hypothetical protein